MKNALRSNFTFHVIAGGVVFALMSAVLSLNTMIVTLNGLFVGAIVSLSVAFGPLIWSLFRGKESDYRRAQELALGFFALWVAYVLAAYVSVWTRSIGEATSNPSYMSALSRYIAVYAAIRQVTAPDYGLGFIYGRDRKILALSLVLGAFTAIALWIIQDQALLADWASVLPDVVTRQAGELLRLGKGHHLVGAA